MQKVLLRSAEVIAPVSKADEVEVSLDVANGEPGAYTCTVTWDSKLGGRIDEHLEGRGYSVVTNNRLARDRKATFVVTKPDPLAAINAVRAILLEGAVDALTYTSFVYTSDLQDDPDGDPDHILVIGDLDSEHHSRLYVSRDMPNASIIEFNTRHRGVDEFLEALRSSGMFEEVRLGARTELDLRLTPDASANFLATLERIIELYQTHLT